MTTNEPATVAVPVELLEALKWEGRLPFSLREYLPKPKPRLVAVDYERLGRDGLEYADSQPDLLTLLDEAADDLFHEWRGYNFDTDVLATLKDRIRTALGVTE